MALARGLGRWYLVVTTLRHKQRLTESRVKSRRSAMPLVSAYLELLAVAEDRFDLVLPRTEQRLGEGVAGRLTVVQHVRAELLQLARALFHLAIP